MLSKAKITIIPNNRKGPYISTEKFQYHRNSGHFDGLKYTTLDFQKREKYPIYYTHIVKNMDKTENGKSKLTNSIR